MNSNQKHLNHVDDQRSHDETTFHSKKIPLWAQIAIVVFVILGIAGIFAYKQASETKDEGGKIAQTGVNITETFDLEVLLSENLPTVVDFGSDTCIPCKEMAPILKELNSSLQGKAMVKFVDVNKNPQASQDFPINLIPTQFFWNADGTPYVPKNSQNAGFTLFKDKQGNHILTSHEGTLTKAEIMDILLEMGMTP